MINGKSLTFAFILSLIAFIPLNAAENSVHERSIEDAERTFGKLSVSRFEQMFQSGKFNFKAYGNDKYTVLHYAVFMNDLDRVKLLVEKGAKVNAKEYRGLTPLFIAANNNNLEIVKYLVENGADVNAKDNVDNTAAFIAAVSGNLEMLQYLVEKGADITVKNKSNVTVLHMAVRSGNMALIKWLEEKG